MSKYITTLNRIRAHDPCANGWRKLLKGLNKTEADDEPLDLLTILNINGLDDALWCMRTMPDHDKEWRLYVVWCTRQIQHLITDPRSIAVIDVAERFALGQTTVEELRDAEAAAWAAWAAARVAAEAATEAAAWTAARDAAWIAARYAAEAAARAAAGDAAGDAVWAAWIAQDASWAAQEKKLRELLEN